MKLEDIVDIFSESIKKLPIENEHNLNEFWTSKRDDLLQTAKIIEEKNKFVSISAQTLINDVFDRVLAETESKILNDNEFLFYKLMDEEKICPKMSSWSRTNGHFVITRNIYAPIDIFLCGTKEIMLPLSIELIKKLHKIGIVHCGISQNTIVHNKYFGLKLDNFENARWIDGLDNQFLLNNPYGEPCSNIEEFLNLELKIVTNIIESMH